MKYDEITLFLKNGKTLRFEEVSCFEWYGNTREITFMYRSTVDGKLKYARFHETLGIAFYSSADPPVDPIEP